MKRNDVERLRDGMVMGSGSERYTATDSDGNEYQYNIAGAMSVLEQVYEWIDHGLTYPDDFPDTLDDEESSGPPSKERIGHAQEAAKYFESELGSLLSTLSESDGELKDSNGNAVADLPNAATSNAKTVEVPDNSA